MTDLDVADLTARDLQERKHGPRMATGDREFKCEICGARCTESPGGEREYGHATDCPRRPDHLPRGDTRYNPVATDRGEQR